MTAMNRARPSRLAYCLAAAGLLVALAGCQEKQPAPSGDYYSGPMKGKSIKTNTDAPGATESNTAAPK